MAECACSGEQPASDADNRSVFCSGSLLEQVQRSNLFPDCKHFVDMSCVYSPSQTMTDFEMFTNCSRNDGSLEYLKMFVEKHFYQPGLELEPWTPPDWKPLPSFLNKVSDPDLKQFAFDVNELWKQLGRRISDDVKEYPEYSSIIYLPKPFIIPSTDCREYRYWESFWIVRGLLQCGMHQTARGMIENFLVLVEQYGYVPACGRIYSIDRTNPPLLIMMMKAYIEVTKDDPFLIQSLPTLETEFETFVSKHSIEVKGKTMYQYRVSPSDEPRPEAYREDVEAAEAITDEKIREGFYTELRSASESGQDFSSRWFVAAGGANQASLKDTKPSAIVPVELNAIIFRSGKILSEFFRKAGNSNKAGEYQDRSCALAKAIRDVLWNAKAGIWLDYDVVNKKSRNYFCCTNFAPLWARAFPLVDTDKVSKAVMEYIKTNKLDEQYGGVPHTMNKTAGEKWDYPNVFPPMMFLIVEGLDNLGTHCSKTMSKQWADRWVKSNYAAFKKESLMYEKYTCVTSGTGGASPNPTPVGYGWTNAVIIEFLCKYGREISLAEDENKAKTSKMKTSFIITSEDNMGGQGKKSCACATSTIGAPPAKVNKSTPAMGTQSDDNCGQLGQKRDEQTQSKEQGCLDEESQEHSLTEDNLTDETSERSAQQQDQNSECHCAEEMPKQEEQKKEDSECPCAEEKRKQEEQKKKDSECPCAEEKRMQEEQKQHDPDCPCAEEKRQKPTSKPVSKAPSRQEQDNDLGCECQPEANKKKKQLEKEPVDEDQARLDREKLSGHYYGLGDKTDDDSGEDDNSEEQTEFNGCGNDDGSDDTEDAGEDAGEDASKDDGGSNEEKSGAAEDCSCSAATKAQTNAESGVCPHCGGIITDPTPNTSTHSGDTKKSGEGCDCSDGDHQKKDKSSVTNQTSQTEPTCACSAGGKGGKGGGAGKSAPGLKNKQFPLADPDDSEENCSSGELKKKKGKICKCDEVEAGN